MKLTYRGISWNAIAAGLPAIETEQVGTFLGQTYRVKKSPQALDQPAATLMYRGVSYTR